MRNAHFSRVHQYPAQPAFRWVLSCRAKRLFHITHRNTRFERFEYSMAGFAKKLATMMCTFGGPASREVGGCRSLQMSGVYRREPRRHFCDLVNRKRPLVNGGGIGPQAEAGSRPLKCTVRQAQPGAGFLGRVRVRRGLRPQASDRRWAGAIIGCGTAKGSTTFECFNTSYSLEIPRTNTLE